jgi:hypothetical protein
VPIKDNDMLLEFKLMGFIKEEDSKKQTNFVRIIYFLMEMPPLLRNPSRTTSTPIVTPTSSSAIVDN